MKQLLYILLPLLTLTSCVDIEEFSDNPSGNFEALWSIMDQRYCFFQEKEEQQGVNWDNIHTEFAAQLSSSMTDYQLFELMSNMLSKLQDGHVNLYSTFDTSRSWQWKENYPQNFSDSLKRIYLGKSTEYRMASGISYRKFSDNIGYMYLPSFEYDISSSTLDEVLLFFADCNGLIIDIRNNGGGLLTSAQALASRFTDEKALVGYIKHKTGTGHSDFSDFEPQYIEPSSNIRWHKPVCILTNRSVYSAANEFTMYMKALCHTTSSPSIVQVGDTTGGGAGMPFSSDLPNGWTIRFSACPTFDHEKQCIEDGISPDPELKVNISQDDYEKGVDTIIETAKKWLLR